MASGKLGSADLAAATNALLCTLDKVSTVNVRFANRNSTSVKIRLAIGTGAEPALADYLTYDLTLPANGIVEDMGIVVSVGESIWAYSSAADVSVRAHGFEE